MCIRDSRLRRGHRDEDCLAEIGAEGVAAALEHADDAKTIICLLYTSDAADERSSVDLGGRRIIKKKHNRETVQTSRTSRIITNNEYLDVRRSNTI